MSESAVAICFFLPFAHLLVSNALLCHEPGLDDTSLLLFLCEYKYHFHGHLILLPLLIIRDIPSNLGALLVLTFNRTYSLLP